METVRHHKSIGPRSHQSRVEKEWVKSFKVGSSMIILYPFLGKFQSDKAFKDKMQEIRMCLLWFKSCSFTSKVFANGTCERDQFPPKWHQPYCRAGCMPGNSWQTQNNALFFLEPFVLVLLDNFYFVEFFLFPWILVLFLGITWS